MPELLTDVITPQGGSSQAATGDVAARLLASNMDLSVLRTNAVLRKDEWLQFDTRVVEIARQRLVAIGDLVNADLTIDIPNGLGTTQIQWETSTDMDPAEVNMSGVTQAQNDRLTYNLNTLPLPIVHKNFNINIRALLASRSLGQPLDLAQAERAARLVAEQTEAILFNGASVTVGGGTIQGYTTASNRNTGSLIAGGWAAATGEQIKDDVLAMITALVGDNMYGPYWLYVPTDYFVTMGDDFKSNSDKTTMQRILEMPGLDQVKASSNLTGGASGEVVLVQPTRDVVDLVIGAQPTTVQWETEGGMISNFKVLSIMIPRIKSDANSQSGIAHYSV